MKKILKRKGIVMKIDEISQNIAHINNRETSSNKKAGEENKPAPENEKAAQPGARVDLSNTSVEFSRAAEMMDEVPKDRVDKIEELKTQTKNNTYTVDAVKIAEKILDDTLSNVSEI